MKLKIALEYARVWLGSLRSRVCLQPLNLNHIKPISITFTSNVLLKLCAFCSSVIPPPFVRTQNGTWEQSQVVQRNNNMENMETMENMENNIKKWRKGMHLSARTIDIVLPSLLAKEHYLLNEAIMILNQKKFRCHYTLQNAWDRIRVFRSDAAHHQCQKQ